MIYDWFNDLARVLRANIMAYDYSGYGKSTTAASGNGIGNKRNHAHGHGNRSNSNQPCEEYVYADIEAAYDYLLNTRKLKPEEIVLYGRSLGSGPSCYLASKTAKAGKSVAGVILQSPLLSAFRVAFNFRYTMIWDKFPNIDYAPNIRCPVFIVHGTQDEVVPFYHGQDLFLSLKQEWRAKPFWVMGAGHNNIEALLRPSGEFVDKLIEFLDLHVSARKGESGVPRPVPVCLANQEGRNAHGHSHGTGNGNGSNTSRVGATIGHSNVSRDSPWAHTAEGSSTPSVLRNVDGIA